MAASITINTTFDPNYRIMTCTVNNGADIPSDIFLYENDNGVPGNFFAVCSLKDYQRFPTYTGTPISNFGARYMKQTFGQKKIPITETDYADVSTTFLANCQAFRAAWLAQNTPSAQSFNL